jgi:hypothetical protein
MHHDWLGVGPSTNLYSCFTNLRKCFRFDPRGAVDIEDPTSHSHCVDYEIKMCMRYMLVFCRNHRTLRLTPSSRLTKGS